MRDQDTLDVSMGRFWCRVLLLFILSGGVAFGQVPPTGESLFVETLDVLTEYLRIDTSNPPGNELEAARYLAEVLSRDDIPSEILEPVPGRANLIARLEGNGARLPLVLLQHLDVVPPAESSWEEDPFSGEVRDGAVWGRGALDMKGLGVIHLMSFIQLKRSGIPLNRDIFLVATADEEAGSRLGVSWLLDNFHGKFRDAGLVLTEGGANLSSEGRLAYVGIEVAQKIPVWLRLSVRGGGGHGALAMADSAPDRLVKALSRIQRLPLALRVEPTVERYFRRVARFQPPALRPVFEDLRSAVADPEFDPETLGPAYRALIQNTVNLTVLRAGVAVNSVPASAWAELDCRLLPGEDPRDFIRQLSERIDDPAVEIQRLLEVRPSRSPEKFELVRAVAEALEELKLDAEVGPSVLPGFTDARFFRERGIPAYGFSPFRLTDAKLRGIHGANERIAVGDLRFGMDLFSKVLERLVSTATRTPAAPIPSGR